MPQAIGVINCWGGGDAGGATTRAVRSRRNDERKSIEFLDYAERVVGDAAVLERQVHERLGDHRLDDEWFDVSTETAIETIRDAAQTLGFELSPWPPKVARASLKREKTTVVNMRFDSEILAKIDDEAKRRGMSRMAWLRWVASSALGAE